jgi:hypothetical protein
MGEESEYPDISDLLGQLGDLAFADAFEDIKSMRLRGEVKEHEFVRVWLDRGDEPERIDIELDMETEYPADCGHDEAMELIRKRAEDPEQRPVRAAIVMFRTFDQWVLHGTADTTNLPHKAAVSVEVYETDLSVTINFFWIVGDDGDPLGDPYPWHTFNPLWYSDD